MKLLLSLIVLLNLSAVYAQNIYLLSSLEIKRKPILTGKSWSFNKKLKKIFKKNTQKLNFKIIVKHSVAPHQLRTILQDEDTHAVFWLSHGREDMVVDQYGNSIQSMFLQLNPNIRFLALIACQGETVFNNLAKLGLFEKYPHLKTFGTDKKVSATHYLRKSLTAFRDTQSEFLEVNSPIHETGTTFQLTRKLESKSSELQVALDDLYIVSTFPAGEAGDIQQLNIFVPESMMNNLNSFDFILRRSFKEMHKSEFGHISISTDQLAGQWNLFAATNGEPFGQNALFEYQD